LHRGRAEDQAVEFCGTVPPHTAGNRRLVRQEMFAMLRLVGDNERAVLADAYNTVVPATLLNLSVDIEEAAQDVDVCRSVKR
jgi:hypothetical protein